MMPPQAAATQLARQALRKIKATAAAVAKPGCRKAKSITMAEAKAVSSSQTRRESQKSVSGPQRK